VNSVPSDVATYCPAYKNLDAERRRAFWVYLMSSLSFFESNHRPELTFKEPFKDSQGNCVISRGLLQLPRESANGYGCGIKAAVDLHQPAVNIACGVRIMAKWVGNDRVIAGGKSQSWRGLARYWSPFRRADRRSQIASWARQQPYCIKA
jgi:hypothetical protein